MWKTLFIFICVAILSSWSFSIYAEDEEDLETTKGEEDVETAKADDGETEEAATSKDAPPEEMEEKEKVESKGMEPGKYKVRLRDLEDRVNRLKEQIFRSKARLSLLAETVLDRKIAGAKANISFKNEMGGSFKLVKATFLLDGGPVFNKADETGELADRDEIKLFDGPLMPGDHTLSVVLHFRGHGYGIFSYLKGYSFKTTSSRTFTVGEGQAIDLEVVGFEKGGVTTDLQDRPAIRYLENIGDFDEDASTKKMTDSADKE